MEREVVPYFVITHGGGKGKGGNTQTIFESLNDAVDFAKVRFRECSTANMQQPILYAAGIERHCAFVPITDGFVRAFALDRALQYRPKAAQTATA